MAVWLATGSGGVPSVLERRESPGTGDSRGSPRGPRVYGRQEPRVASTALDVLLQIAVLVLGFLQAGLDEIADGDEARHSVPVHDR